MKGREKNRRKRKRKGCEVEERERERKTMGKKLWMDMAGTGEPVVDRQYQHNYASSSTP